MTTEVSAPTEQLSNEIPPVTAVSRECIECDTCKTANPSKWCSKCHTAFYCSQGCQRANWVEHKPYCIDIKTMRENCKQFSQGVAVDGSHEATPEGPCAICLSDAIDNPVVLPACKHAFCFACLQRWQREPLQSEYSPGRARGEASRCPLCRIETESVEKAATNRASLYASRAGASSIGEEEKRLAADKALKELAIVLENDPANPQALFTKVEIYLILCDGGLAADTCRFLLSAFEDGLSEGAEIERDLEDLEAATREGRHDEAEVMVERVQARMATAKRRPSKSVVWDVKLQLGAAQEMEEKWSEALETYRENAGTMFVDNTSATPVQHRKVVMGMSRCYYALGQYEMAITVGQAAIEMNRHFPEVHRPVALAQKDSGDLEGAIVTMKRAMIYETPWDGQNRKKAMCLLKELIQERKKKDEQ